MLCSMVTAAAMLLECSFIADKRIWNEYNRNDDIKMDICSYSNELKNHEDLF